MAQRQHHQHNAVLGMNRTFVPTLPLEDGEVELARYQADTMTFWRSQAWIALFFSILAAGILIGIGNAYWWTGVVGAMAAIGVRTLYLGPDERKDVWVLTNRRLMGPMNRSTTLSNISAVNVIWTAVQVVTITGDKILIRYRPDPAETKAEIERAAS